MIVFQLTIEQKDLLLGQLYNELSIFNPTQDADGNWFISIEEIEQCDCEGFEWIHDLPEITFNPFIPDDLLI